MNKKTEYWPIRLLPIITAFKKRNKCNCVPRRSPLPWNNSKCSLSPKNSLSAPSSDIPLSDAFLFHPVLSSCHNSDTYPSRPSSLLYTKTKTNFSLIRRHTLLERRDLNLFNGIGYFAFFCSCIRFYLQTPFYFFSELFPSHFYCHFPTPSQIPPSYRFYFVYTR